MSTLCFCMSWRRCVKRSVVGTFSISIGLRRRVDVVNSLVFDQRLGVASGRSRLLSMGKKLKKEDMKDDQLYEIGNSTTLAAFTGVSVGQTQDILSFRR